MKTSKGFPGLGMTETVGPMGIVAHPLRTRPVKRRRRPGFQFMLPPFFSRRGRSRNDPRPPTRTVGDVGVIPLGSLAVVPVGVWFRFGVGGRLGNSIRIIRRWAGVRIGIGVGVGVGIIPVGIVVGKPIGSTEVDAGASVEMASTIISTRPAIIPTISSMATTIPSVAAIISTMCTGPPTPTIPSVAARPGRSSTPSVSLCLSWWDYHG
jgi:hypothetical protein